MKSKEIIIQRLQEVEVAISLAESDNDDTQNVTYLKGYADALQYALSDTVLMPATQSDCVTRSKSNTLKPMVNWQLVHFKSIYSDEVIEGYLKPNGDVVWELGLISPVWSTLAHKNEVREILKYVEPVTKTDV